MNLRRFSTIVLLVVLTMASVPGVVLTNAAPPTSFPPPISNTTELPVQGVVEHGRDERTDDPVEPDSTELPPDVPANWWSTVQRDVRRSEYHVTWQITPTCPTSLPPTRPPTAPTTCAPTLRRRASALYLE